jgi:hypothetical protein
MVMMMQSTKILSVVLMVAAALVAETQGFAPTQQPRSSATSTTTQRNGIFDKVGEFFEELDAFVDDATSRRLGNGSKFYGKRRSKFYGEQDKDRKLDRTVTDVTGELVRTKKRMRCRVVSFIISSTHYFCYLCVYSFRGLPWA